MMDTTKIDLGFNRIKPWLSAKLEERGLTVEGFCVQSGHVVNPLLIRRWYSDAARPYPHKMKAVCEALSRLPVKLDDGTEYLEEVPWSEGMSKFQPKPRAWAAHYVKKPSS